MPACHSLLQTDSSTAILQLSLPAQVLLVYLHFEVPSFSSIPWLLYPISPKDWKKIPNSSDTVVEIAEVFGLYGWRGPFQRRLVLYRLEPHHNRVIIIAYFGHREVSSSWDIDIHWEAFHHENIIQLAVSSVRVGWWWSWVGAGWSGREQDSGRELGCWWKWQILGAWGLSHWNLHSSMAYM